MRTTLSTEKKIFVLKLPLFLARLFVGTNTRQIQNSKFFQSIESFLHCLSSKIFLSFFPFRTRQLFEEVDEVLSIEYLMDEKMPYSQKPRELDNDNPELYEKLLGIDWSTFLQSWNKYSFRIHGKVLLIKQMIKGS